MKLALFVGLGVFGAFYIAVLVTAALRARSSGGSRVAPSVFEVVLGFVACFFDTLGIGSFAPTTAALKLRGLVADETIPGTLNVGYTLPTLAQAFIFIAFVVARRRGSRDGSSPRGGSIAFAALLHGKVPDIAGRKVGIVLSGGNVDPDRFGALISGLTST